MRWALFVFYALAALLALEGVSMLLRRRADPARVRNRLRGLAQRVAQIDAGAGKSILRSGGGLQLPSLAGLEKLLYRARSSLTIRRFFALSVILAVCGFAGVFIFTENLFQCAPAVLLGLLHGGVLKTVKGGKWWYVTGPQRR